jgi:DNA-binding NtrC family response regulator
MDATVLFVDDDRRLIRVYADAIDEEDGLSAHVVHNPDDALAYLRAGGPAEVVVWDMMMLPGKAFAEVDTEGGTSTGRYLHAEMRKLRPGSTFILLTNQPFDPEEIEKLGSFGSYKPDTSPEELATFIVKQLSPVSKK